MPLNFTGNLRNIFGNYPGQSPPMFGRFDPYSVPQQAPIVDRFRNVMSPYEVQTPAFDRYLGFLETIPKREQYSPSKWRQLAAALAGGSEGWFRGPSAGIETAQSLSDLPYTRALRDWGIKGQGMKEAADIEARKNTAENTAWRNFMNAYLGIGREDRLTKQGDRSLAIREQNAETNRDLARARIESLGKGNFKMFSDTKGNDYLYDSTTGQTRKLDIDVFGDPEKFKANLERQLEVAGVYAGESAENRASRERIAREAEAGRMARDNPPAFSEAAQKGEESRILRDMSVENPEYLNKGWIKQRTTGEFYIAPQEEPGLFERVFGGNESANFQKFYQEFQSRKSGRVTPRAPTVRPPTPSGPKIGEERPYQGGVIKWDGKGWIKVR